MCTVHCCVDCIVIGLFEVASYLCVVLLLWLNPRVCRIFFLVTSVHDGAVITDTEVVSVLRGVARIMHFVVIDFHIIMFPNIRSQRVQVTVSEQVVHVLTVSPWIVWILNCFCCVALLLLCGQFVVMSAWQELLFGTVIEVLTLVSVQAGRGWSVLY